MKEIIIFIFILIIWGYTVWNGIKIGIYTGNINFEVESYPLKRFFKNK